MKMLVEIKKILLAFFSICNFSPTVKTVVHSLLSVLLLTCTFNVSAENIYSLGVVPQYKAKEIHNVWQPIINEINKKTGIQFVILSKPDIATFEAALKAGEFDFAYMNPYHMLIASIRQGYQPLVRDIGKSLQGILVVPAKSHITDIQELDNQSIAFPSANALGASLLIRQELSDNFNININPRYVKTHDSVYLNVILNQTPAGGGVENTLNNQPEKIRDKLRVIYHTSKVASHPIAAHPRVPESVANMILDALLSLDKDDKGRKLLASIPIEKIGRTSMSEYTPLIEKRLKRFTMELD